MGEKADRSIQPTPAPQAGGQLQATTLKCEYACDPLGIETRHPRLSWVLQHPARGQFQTAFQVLAASAPELLNAAGADLWDSGKVLSPHTSAGYAGVPLASRSRCWWTVRAWDKAGRPGPYSPPAWFEMGLLRPGDWQAGWIGHPAGASDGALYFRKDFTLAAPVRRARAYLCGLGLAEFRLNGQKVGQRVLEPAPTVYARKVLYTTYDVQPYLQVGANTAGVITGSGWFGAHRLLFQMEIETADGALTTICSGDDLSPEPWQVGPGPILRSSLYEGESYDARLELPGWDCPGGAPRWAAPVAVAGPGGRLASQSMEPVRVVQTLAPQALAQPKPGAFVYDFGQNFAGWARLRVRGPRGTRVRLRFAEALHADGTLNPGNLPTAQATDEYILKGQGLETWEPRFTYHGFRYVQVEGYPGQPGPEALQGQVVRPAVEALSEFHCSQPLLNQIYAMVRWTESSHLHRLPSGCPQRDGRPGWLEDMAVRTEAALFNFDVQRLFARWVGDIADAQDRASGAIADSAPSHRGSRPADPVSQAYLIVPWLLFIHNGDGRTLAEQYDGMKRWVDFLTRQARGHILETSRYGDWAPPTGAGGAAASSATPGALVATALYYYAAHLIYQFAGIVGKAQDKEDYAALMDAIEDAFNERFWDEAAGGYGANSQACNALPLYLDIVPEARKARVLANLVRDVERHGAHLTTGALGTQCLLEALSAGGRADVAYQVVTQQGYPSWGYMLANGATTLWERWELPAGGGGEQPVSRNHPRFASVGAWLMKSVAGLAPDLHFPAFEEFIVRPRLTGQLAHARVALQTVRGRVEVAWEQAAAGLSLHLRVPTGCRARVYLPKPAGDGPFTLLEGQTPVWQEGAPTGAFAEVAYEGIEPGWVVFRVGSGRYAFRWVPGAGG